MKYDSQIKLQPKLSPDQMNYLCTLKRLKPSIQCEEGMLRMKSRTLAFIALTSSEVT